MSKCKVILKIILKANAAEKPVPSPSTKSKIEIFLKHGKGGKEKRRASQVALVVKNLPANAGDIRDSGLIPGSGRFPAGGNGNPFQYSCLENPMDRRAWCATVDRVPKSRIRLKGLCMHSTPLIRAPVFWVRKQKAVELLSGKECSREREES